MEIKVITDKKFNRKDLQDSSQILSEAFRDEPGLNWLCPSKQHESWFYETTKLILSSQESQLIVVNEDDRVVACALVSPPNFKPSLVAQIIWLWRVWLNYDWKIINKTLQYLQKAEKEKNEKDFCLEFIGVSNQFRGKGISRDLIKLIVTKIGSNSLFLTTADHRNVSLYEHLQFALVGRHRIPGVDIFAMRNVGNK